jgi:sialic acid synthase SpsE
MFANLYGDKVFIIAEIGMNHNGDTDKAKALVDAAASTGVDAVKFQTHIAEAETTKDAPAPSYFKDESRFDFFKRTAFSLEEHRALNKHAEERGVKFISSPFSIEAVKLLEKVGVEVYKVPSGEVTNIPYLEFIAKTKKTILLSSGMSNLFELDEAVAAIRKYNDRLVILQCTSSYPCSYNEVGLNMLNEFRSRYGVEVGFSDHTLNIFASLAAAALGARVIERHFTISKDDYGPDAKFSLDPKEMTRLVKGIRAVEEILANPVDKNDISKFQNMKRVFEKSLVAARDIPKGAILNEEMIAIKKPGNGIPTKHINKIIGKITVADIKKDTLFSLEMVE